MKYNDEAEKFPFYVIYAYGEETGHRFSTKKEAISWVKKAGYSVFEVCKISCEVVYSLKNLPKKN